MTFDFRYPQITGATEREQIQQMMTYIHQLVDELKWALNTIESPQGNVVIVQHKGNTNSGVGTIGMDELNDDSVQAHFNEIKPLIIKSADIVNAYYDVINKRLEGLYVAQSDFGTFIEQTSQEIEATSQDITQIFTNVQTIASDVGIVVSEVQSIDSKVKSIDNSLATVQTNYSNVTSKVQNIDSSVQTIDTNLKKVEGNVGTLDTEIKGVKTGVQAVEQKAQAIEGEVQTIGSNVETIGYNVQEIETDLQDTKVGIDSTIGRIADEVGVIDKDLQGVKAGVESNIKDLSDEVGKVDSKLEDAKIAIGDDIDKLKKSLDTLNSILVEVNAKIKTGLIDYDENGIPIYGLEIGQKNTINGVEVFNKFARFSAGRLSFYDNNGTEVAYISDYKIYITHAEVTGTLKLGGYLVDTTKGVTFKWVGRS
jgi:archaellum component FlaC